MLFVIPQQKRGTGKTTTASNLAVLLARLDPRVFAVDTDPQFALTRHLELEVRSLDVNLVDVLVGRAAAAEAIDGGIHGLDVIPAARELRTAIVRTPEPRRVLSWRTSSQKAHRSNSAASDGDLPWFDLRIIRAMQSSARPRQDG